MPRILHRRSLSIAVLAALTLAGVASARRADALAVPAQTQPANPDAKINPRIEGRVIADLEAGNFAAALTGAKGIVAANPQSPKAQKLMGVVLLDQQKPAAALPYFQKALQLAPNDPTVNELLLQAYAQTGDKTGRDQQIAILRGYHNDGKHPEFARIPSFLIETIPVGGKIVQANEYFTPYGQYHFYYRFNVFDAKQHLESFLALESDDADQVLFAQKHPKEAAAGKRRFSLDGYALAPDGHVIQALYTFYDGEPSYDTVRDLVVKLVKEGKSPTPPPAKPAPKAGSQTPSSHKG